jgi:ABC-type phosphate transport system substrate-binding protein
MLGRLVLVTLTVVAAVAAQSPSAEPPFVVIVSGSNAVVSMRRADLSAIFMRKTRSWPDGTQIIPVDQPPASRTREVFSRAVHGKSVAFVTRYWHRLIFSGRGIPPIEMTSDAAVIEFVRTNRGAVGYVDRQNLTGDDVKVVPVIP